MITKKLTYLGEVTVSGGLLAVSFDNEGGGADLSWESSQRGVVR